MFATGAENLWGHEVFPSMFLFREGGYKGRTAVVANQTSVVGATHLVDTLLRAGVNVTKIFCPEHGFRGTAAAGAKVDNSTDPKTGLPIISLYGKNKKPTPEQLKDVDCVLFDLQDVGCRPKRAYRLLSSTAPTPTATMSTAPCWIPRSTALSSACIPCR